MKKLAFALPLLAVLAAPPALAADRAEAGAAIVAAVKVNNEARAAGFEWRDTYKKLLGPAKKAYQEGDYDKAAALAKKAQMHAKMGLQQAQVARNAGPDF